jgi:phosphoribosylanthranilate isomerase
VVVLSDSPRSVPIGQAKAIFSALGPFITTVAVTHTDSATDLEEILALGPDAIQISHPFVFDREPGSRVIRVIGRGDPLPSDCDAVIVDDSHGNGRQFDRTYAREAVLMSKIQVILAGGLTPENVGAAIEMIRPYAVDVATGVEESPGIKDFAKIARFIAACRRR